MASDADVVRRFCEQMEGKGNYTFREMCGEYVIYRDGDAVALVCGNRLFMKSANMECDKPPTGAASPNRVENRAKFAKTVSNGSEASLTLR